MSYEHSTIPAALWHGAKFDRGLDADKGTPVVLGQLYEATDTEIIYRAVGTASSDDWIPILVIPTEAGQLLSSYEFDVDVFGWMAVPAASANGKYLVSDDTEISGFNYVDPSVVGSKRVAKVKGFFNNATIGGAGGNGAITWNTEDFDTGGMWVNTDRSRMTAPATGIYQLHFYATILKPVSSILQAKWRFRLNGSTLFGPTGGTQLTSSDSEEITGNVRIMDEVELVLNDYVEVHVHNYNAVSPNISQWDEEHTGFSMKEL